MTDDGGSGCDVQGILIHTSVKLVTLASGGGVLLPAHFNPHEREARDCPLRQARRPYPHFNPHEREARDNERRAIPSGRTRILIHTSVKLVTDRISSDSRSKKILIHTSVKLVTGSHGQYKLNSMILIHTSVKLVTAAAEKGDAGDKNFNPHEREARDLPYLAA